MVLLTRPFASFLLALSQKRIDLKSMLGVYVVMGTGLLVAFLTLIGEIFWNRREKLKTLNKTERFGLRPESSWCYLLLVFLFVCFFVGQVIEYFSYPGCLTCSHLFKERITLTSG